MDSRGINMHCFPNNSIDCDSVEPFPVIPHGLNLTVAKHSRSLQANADIREPRTRLARRLSLRYMVRIIVATAPLMCQGAVSMLIESGASAQTLSRHASIDRFDKLIDEASDRFAVPARWIRAVIAIESGGDEHSISSSWCYGANATDARQLGGPKRSLWPWPLSVRCPRQHLSGHCLPQGNARSLRLSGFSCRLPRRSVAI